MKKNEIFKNVVSALKKFVKFIFKNKIMLVVTIVALLAIALGILSKVGLIKNSSAVKSETITKMVEKIQELSTIKYRYTNVGSYENQSELVGIKIPLTYKRFIVTYDGVMKIGINLKNIDINVSEKKISIKLPKPEILSNQTLDDSIKFFDQTSGIFNPIKLDDYTDFVKALNTEALEKAQNSDLMEEATENTKLVLSKLLTLNPEINDYEIVFEEMK